MNNPNERFESEASYLQALESILDEGWVEENRRTKAKVLRVPSLVFSFKADFLPLLQTRRIYPKTAAAELAWSIKGDKSPEFIEQYSKIWEKFTVNGEVESAYGYRWRRHFKRDQLADAMQALKNDPTSRQAIVMAWDPGNDGLLNMGKWANVPCPLGFQLLIIDSSLYLNVFQRSMDMVLGAPYDILMYSLLNCAIAKSLGVKAGEVTFYVGDAHIYDYLEPVARQMEKNWLGIIAKSDLDLKRMYGEGPFESWSVEDIEANPHGYVDYVKMRTEWYAPLWTSPRLEPIK